MTESFEVFGMICLITMTVLASFFIGKAWRVQSETAKALLRLALSLSDLKNALNDILAFLSFKDENAKKMEDVREHVFSLRSTLEALGNEVSDMKKNKPLLKVKESTLARRQRRSQMMERVKQEVAKHQKSKEKGK